MPAKNGACDCRTDTAIRAHGLVPSTAGSTACVVFVAGAASGWVSSGDESNTGQVTVTVYVPTVPVAGVAVDGQLDTVSGNAPQPVAAGTVTCRLAAR